MRVVFGDLRSARGAASTPANPSLTSRVAIFWRGIVTNTKALVIAVAMSLGVVSGTQAADVAHGHVVFGVWCTGCHEPLPGASYAPPAGTYVLEQHYHGRIPSALEQRTDLTATLIRTTVRNGRNMMPQTRKTEISDSDLDDLIAYLTQNNTSKHDK
jgi:mono/diheme cytochrome c family protein